MATSSETFNMILSASGDADAVINKTAAAAKGLGNQEDALGAQHQSLFGATRALKSGLSQVFAEMGVGGPAGHVAAFAALHLSEGFGAMTGAAVGAGIGLTALIMTLKSGIEEKKSFDKAVRSGDIGFFRTEVDSLKETVSTKPLDPLASNFMEFFHAIETGLFNNREKFAAYQYQLNLLNNQKISDLTREWMLHVEMVGAGNAEKVMLEERKALADLNIEYRKGTMSVQEYLTKRTGLLAVSRASMFQVEEEIKLIGQSKEAVEILTQARLQQRLVNMQMGDPELVRGVELELAASKKRLAAMDQELLKSQQLAVARRNALVAVDPKNVMGDVVRQINEALKTGLPPSPEQIKTMDRMLVQVQRKAFQTFGLEVPGDVQSAIDKVDALIKKMAEAAGVDVKELKDKFKEALSGQGAGGLTGMGSLKDVEFIGKDFSNLIGPSNQFNKEMEESSKLLKDIRDSSEKVPAIFGDAVTDARLLRRELQNVGTVLDQLNARGGIKILPSQPSSPNDFSLNDQLKREALTTNEPG